MTNQDNYNKYRNFYDQLKNQWVDAEEERYKLFERTHGGGEHGQWDRETWHRLVVEQHRPALSYNKLIGVLMYLTGSQRQSRAYMMAYPTDEDRSGIASDIITKLMYWNFNKTHYEFQLSLSFVNTVIGGIGWKQDWWDYIEGHWVCKAIDPFRIRFDINTTDSLKMEDCRYMQDTLWMSKEQIIALNPSDDETKKEMKYLFSFLEPSGRSTAYIDKQYTGGWSWANRPRRGNFDFIDYEEGRYRIIDHHEKRDIPMKVLVDSRDENIFENVSTYEDDQIEGLKKQNPYFELHEWNETKFYHGMICPAIQMVVNEEAYPIQTDMFSIKPMFCYNIVPQLKNTASVMTNLVDINESLNKRRSTMLEYLMKTVGGNWIAPEDAFKNYEHLWLSNEMGVLLKYKGKVAPQRDIPPPIHQGLESYEQEDKELFTEISEVSPASKGRQESANETGRLHSLKLQQTEVMFAMLFDNAQLSQENDARSCLKHIQMGMTTPRAIRVLTDGNKPEELRFNYQTIDGILNDVTVGEFDVEIDYSKPSKTAQQIAFYQTQAMMQNMPPELQMVLIDLLIEASDHPRKTEMARRVRAFLKLKMGFDPENPEQIYNTPTQGQPQQNQLTPNNQKQLAQAGVQ